MSEIDEIELERVHFNDIKPGDLVYVSRIFGNSYTIAHNDGMLCMALRKVRLSNYTDEFYAWHMYCLDPAHKPKKFFRSDIPWAYNRLISE